MNVATWVHRNCSFVKSAKVDLVLPAGTMLFHGTLEDFDQAQLKPGGYDEVFWTTEAAYGPAIAQTYIPRAGSSTVITPSHLIRPTQNRGIQNLQKMIGIHYDYEDPEAIEWEGSGYRTKSFSGPNMENGVPFPQLPTEDYADSKLKEIGYKPLEKDYGPGYNKYEILFRNVYEPFPPGETATGRLFVLKARQPLRIFNYAGNEEGDLMSPDYHRIDIFRAAEAKGYDGIRINDFAQVHDWGNIGHSSIGIFRKSIPKLEWETIPAKHPNYDESRKTKSTPEWDEYMRQKGVS